MALPPLQEFDLVSTAAMHPPLRRWVIRYKSLRTENRSKSAVPRKRRKVRALASAARRVTYIKIADALNARGDAARWSVVREVSQQRAGAGLDHAEPILRNSSAAIARFRLTLVVDGHPRPIAEWETVGNHPALRTTSKSGRARPRGDCRATSGAWA
jgi:hypothetical protein